jgi:hypothetical protein
MKQKELLDNIKKYLAVFAAHVKISNANNEYDINLHSENVIIPILNLLYNCDLSNANYSKRKNAPAIDLVDEGKKLAFQVTATSNLTKIKKTLTSFFASEYSQNISDLYVYIITEKQRSYAQGSLDKITKKRIHFSAIYNILDSGDIYRRVSYTEDLDIIEKVESILRRQFAETRIGKTLNMARLEEFKENYKKSCLTNFSRVNFFGLSVGANRPREVELYLLFTHPKFIESTIGTPPSHLLRIISTQLRSSTPGLIHVEDTKPITNLAYPYDPQLFENISNKEIVKRRIFSLSGIHNLSSYESAFSLQTSQYGTDSILFQDILSKGRNIVIIGNPGAGKSMLIKYAICKILEKDEQVFSEQDILSYIPIRIELYKYNKSKKSNPSGFLSYSSKLMAEEYQISISPEDLEAIISTFPSLCFFDGLDEIFDIQERISVRNEIEAFVKMFPKVKSVVTSRTESYEEVSLNIEIFQEFRILNFDNTQIKEFVNKWYAIEESRVSVREKEVKDCMAQLKEVDVELKQNPLLLSLILLLYRNELDIPTSKLSIYESCTNTIVETRDAKEKKLTFNLKINNKIAVFAALAYWQFTNEKSNINFESVKTFVKSYLINKGEFSDDNIARDAAEELLDFAKTRSIYVENKFTHKTFLEYFTAYYIYSNYFGKPYNQREFEKKFTAYLGQSSWWVVLELLVCKIDSMQTDFEVIDKLIQKNYSKNENETLTFFIPILKYIKNVSPKKINFLLQKTMGHCLSGAKGKTDQIELLFSHLVKLNSNYKYRNDIENSFRMLIADSKFERLYLNAFAYEFAIVCGNTTLIKIINDAGLDCDDEYIFILKYYLNLYESEKYLTTMSLFINKYGNVQTLEFHKSLFNQKLFFRSSTFNWNLSYITNDIFGKNGEERYKDLLALGISKGILLAVGKTCPSEMDISNYKNWAYVHETNNKDFNKFNEVLIEEFGAIKKKSLQ